jgi:hypothetical protein
MPTAPIAIRAEKMAGPCFHTTFWALRPVLVAVDDRVMAAWQWHHGSIRSGMPVVIRDARALRWTAQKLPRAPRRSFFFVPDGVEKGERWCSVYIRAHCHRSNCTCRILLLFELVLLVLDFRDLLADHCREMRRDQARTGFLFLRRFRGDGLMAMATTRSDVRGPTPDALLTGADAWTLEPLPPTHTGRRPLAHGMVMSQSVLGRTVI